MIEQQKKAPEISVDKKGEEQTFPGLDSRQEQAVFLLASGYGLSDTAKTAGVCRRTLYSWLHEDHLFRAYYKSVRNKIYDENMGRLFSISSLALDRLPKLIESDDERISLDAIKFALGAGQLVEKP